MTFKRITSKGDFKNSLFFKEYKDNSKYLKPKRQCENDILDIRLYCNHFGCRIYIKGKEGYNGKFTAETGQTADLRNQSFVCSEHEKELIDNVVYLRE